MRAALALLPGLLLVLTGCGLLGGAGEEPGVAGRTFLSVDVMREGRSSALVDGTRVRMTFEDGQVSAQAGCNTLFGDYRVDGEVLRVDAMGGTRLGCPDVLLAQDAWLVELLGSGPRLALDGDFLTLSGQGAVLTFLDHEVAGPDRPLVGTVWRVQSLVAGDTVSTVTGRAVATLTFRPDGTLEVLGSCNQGGADYRLQDDEQVVVLSGIRMTAVACDDERDDLDRAVLELLRGRELRADVTADTLTLTAGGRGLLLREL